ncbi:uncharacterized protein [Penaeus vannamei]|uniref:uncharacterized protein isoform X1 n=2 Tax=Penaeus vannamei TaxID=6689 RepID=UPI00387F7D78
MCRKRECGAVHPRGSSMCSVTGVLLGVAEVKLPLRRLPQEMRTHVAVVSHAAVLHDETASKKENQDEFLEERERFIGVVDGFYALQEVSVEVADGRCEVKRGQDVVLKHRLCDVIIATTIPEYSQRVVYITRDDSFGRAAVVLQMMSLKHVEKLLEFFTVEDTARLAPPSNGFPPGSVSPKESRASWSRGMGKKISSMLMSLANNSGNKRTPSRPEDRCADVIVTPASDAKVGGYPESDSQSDSDEGDDESSIEDSDSKSESKFYEDHGLDKAVQESLYDDDSVDSVSQGSDSSQAEANAAVIEAEIRYFVKTDADFLRALQSLDEDRERLSSEETPQFIREKLTLLFAQIKALTLLHRELHGEFERSGISPQLLSEAIVGHRDDYEKYVYFMENIPTVDGILSAHSDYFKAKMPELPEKLRKPRMRLHYYVLTLETLLKRVSTREEKRSIQEAIDVLKVPLKKADSKLFLGAVTGSPFDLSNFGNLIRHSDLHLRRGGDLPKRVYHVLMLKTIIIITLSQGRNYKYITSFRMDQVSLGKRQGRGVLFTLEVRNGPRGQAVPHVFKAKNINMQQLWINDIKWILREKSQTTTPRNSFIEGDPELRVSGRRSKFRRGQSFERVLNKGPSHPGSSPEIGMEDEGDQAGNASGYDGRPRRRGAVKKHSSAPSRPRPVVRQASGYTSDGDSAPSWKSHTSPSPLAVWTVFPQLESLFKALPPDDKEGNFSHPASVFSHERKYTAILNEQLGQLLEDEFPRPPSCIVTHMRALFVFHFNTFHNLLEEATSEGCPEDIAKCFIICAERIRELYAAFLADRVRLDSTMREMDLKNPYVYPLIQVEVYMKCLLQLGETHSSNPGVKATFDEALSIFKGVISEANTILLTETVDGSPFDLDECGTVLMEGDVKVRFPGQMMRQDIHAVLLETMILLLEYRHPRYQYVEALRMDTVGLGPANDVNSFSVEVREGAARTLTYVFKAPRKDEREKWQREITDILKQQVLKLKEKQKRRLGSEMQILKNIEANDAVNLHSVSPRQKLLETSL